jgi:hypothetical protein
VTSFGGKPSSAVSTALAHTLDSQNGIPPKPVQRSPEHIARIDRRTLGNQCAVMLEMLDIFILNIIYYSITNEKTFKRKM